MSRPTDGSVGRALVSTLWVGLVFLLLGVALVALAQWHGRISSPLAHLFFLSGGLVLAAAAGFLPAYLTGSARRRGHRQVAVAIRTGKSLPAPLEVARSLADRVWARLRAVDWRGDWLPVLTALAISLGSLYALYRGWRGSAEAASPLLDEVTAAVLLIVAFALLVLERRYAVEEKFAEGPSLARLCRVPLVGAVVLAVAAVLRWLGFSWYGLLENATVAVAALVAGEIALRSAIYVFLPLPPLELRQSHAVSAIAGLLRAQIPNVRALNASVRNQFGIDLARSWSLGFLRRAMAPLLVGSVVAAWLLTGVTAIGLDERAVYEAFGKPSAILGPGLHLHLPWPFGVLRRIAYGEVREIAIERDSGETVAAAAATDIEGEPPTAADSLWDTSQQENSFLVADFSNGQQTFEAMNIDIGIVYRIGLSDSAAMQAAYHVADTDALVQSSASQILAHYFARNTIANILGQDRQAFIARFQAELQARLATISSGIEVMAVVVEAIHPPPKAAGSYQGVQAAAVESTIKVSSAEAEAAREMKMAAVVANATRNDAASAAAERLGDAKTVATLFDGERKSYAAGGASFLLEHRMEKLSRGLADKPIIVLDHRIAAAQFPTFDMRQVRPARSNFGDAGAD